MGEVLQRRRGDQVRQPLARVLRRRGRPEGRQCHGKRWHSAKLTVARGNVALLAGNPRHRLEGRPGVEGTSERSEPRYRHGTSRPPRQPVRQLGQRLRALVARQQRAHRVGSTDHTVGGAGHDSRQQPGPPVGENRTPRRLLNRRPEISRPVADAPEVAERLRPVRVGDPVNRGRHLVEPTDIGVQPCRNLIAETAPDENLRGHRTVVGQGVAPLGAGPAQPLVRIVQDRVHTPDPTSSEREASHP